ncbi:MAG TPA: hypothetical protein VGB85_11655 [Nannocystis sp.]|jgi:hypothetical protein
MCSKEERLWRLLTTLFHDDQQLRRFIALGQDSREITTLLPGAGASLTDLSLKVVELLSARGTVPAMLEHLATWHLDCTHGEAIAELQRSWNGDPRAEGAMQHEKRHTRLRLPAGADLDVLPYIKGWSQLRRPHTWLTLRLTGSTLEIDAFPYLLRRGAVVHGPVSYAVGERASDDTSDPPAPDPCEQRRRSTYSYYPLGRGHGPAFDLTLGDQVLLLDSPGTGETDASVQTLVIEYDL